LEEFYGNYSHLHKLGIDVTKDMIECRMSVHSMQGGIRINERTESNLKGLYAIGSCAAAHYPRLHGCLWTGSVGADYASARAREIKTPELDWSQVEEEGRRIRSLLKRKSRNGFSPAQLERRVRDIMMRKVHYVMTKEKLESALDELLEVRRIVTENMRLGADTRKYNYGLVDALDLLNMLDFAELVVRACLFRKESRGPFVRQDYPDLLPHACNTILKLKDGRVEIRAVPVEFRYVKPEDM
jgi:succinate dehydrogenase/fumarate reductase flavoprotein subunit